MRSLQSHRGTSRASSVPAARDEPAGRQPSRSPARQTTHGRVTKARRAPAFQPEPLPISGVTRHSPTPAHTPRSLAPGTTTWSHTVGQVRANARSPRQPAHVKGGQNSNSSSVGPHAWHCARTQCHSRNATKFLVAQMHVPTRDDSEMHRRLCLTKPRLKFCHTNLLHV